MRIPLAKPSITESDISEVVKVLRTGMLVQGEFVELLEQKIADFVGVKHAIAVSSCTAALHLSLLSGHIGPGDEVIVPAFSFVATANVVELVGAMPVFVDIDPQSYTIDTTKIEECITAKTKAIIAVHEFGLTAETERLEALAKKHSLLFIEDAACSLGATRQNRQSGSFGDLGAFSFHPRKAITSGEGGIVVTRHDKVAETIRLLRNHGMVRKDDGMRFYAAGYNYRLTEFQAALINSQLTRFTEILQKRNAIASVYLNEIDQDAFILPSYKPSVQNHTWQTFHIRLKKEGMRNELIAFLNDHEIQSGIGAQCIPDTDFYKNKYGYNAETSFPMACISHRNGLAIPMYDQMSLEEAHYVADHINRFARNRLL